MAPFANLLVIPAALYFGAPADNAAAFVQGLFCDQIALVESIVEIADRGGDPQQAVRDVNAKLGRRACLYTTHAEVRAEVVKLERTIAANKTEYGIYEVYVSAIGRQSTEIGSLVWKFSRPLLMYTLRKAPPAGRDVK